MTAMHIEILPHVRKGGYEVRVVDAEGRTVCTFAYLTIESARTAARAWTSAYGNCSINDKTGVK
jgi:hypothetical protein